MAMFKIVREEYNTISDMQNLVNYCLMRDKIKSGLVGAYAVDINHIVDQMQTVKKIYGKDDGNQVWHIIVSFTRKETVPMLLLEPAWQIIEHYGRRHQVFFAIHEDTDYPHFHIVFNTVSYIDGKRFENNYGEFYWLKNFLDHY